MTRILITSALPYINGVKHLGNLVGSLLPSDAYARYMRLRGHEVMHICATDEHGTPAELAAAKAGVPVAQFCKEMYQKQKGLCDDFSLDFDHFGRSSSERNHKLTQHFAGRLAEVGLIEEVKEKQVYSNADGRYLPDRYIEGTCPNCGSTNARGDQCENCTKQLDPTDLIEPRSAISGSTDLEVRETKHLYLRQSKLRDKLRDWINSKTDWPVLTTSIAKKWLDDGDGLQDRGITRDLDWGIPVKKGEEDWPGMEGKVFYVWFDAPIEYIAATAEWADANGKSEADWRSWWRDDEGAGDVKYVQFMAKDNVPFHTLSFPVTIMGSGEPWKLVDHLKAFNWLTYEGGKFSTSSQRGIFMDQAIELLPSDYWRWWLLSNAPESSDSDFTWAGFQSGINNDLNNVLGNFISRATKFCESRFKPSDANANPQVPNGHGQLISGDQTFTMDLHIALKSYEAALDALEFRKAAKELRSIWVLGNEFFQEMAPWALLKEADESPENATIAQAIVWRALNLIGLFSIISRPFIPDTCEKIAEAMNVPADQPWPKDAYEALNLLQPGHSFTVPENLFRKIDDGERSMWEEKFGGVSEA